ncbi:MAG: hypothetical protein IKV69_01580 [Clostridia bacterium]|nr:hypothetical protein [Clostridia bacterium]
MKRSIILKTYAFVGAAIFGFTFLIYYLCTKEIFPLWFSLGCFCIGTYHLIRAYFFVQDGAFWFGCLLFFVSILGFLKFFGLILPEYVLPLYFLCLPLASVFTGVFYKKQLHYKISFILILEDFLILLYSKSILPLLWLILINLGTIVAFFGGKYVFYRKRRL